MTIKERENIKEAALAVTRVWCALIKPDFRRSDCMGEVLDAKELLDNLLLTEPRKARDRRERADNTPRKADGNS